MYKITLKVNNTYYLDELNVSDFYIFIIYQIEYKIENGILW